MMIVWKNLKNSIFQRQKVNLCINKGRGKIRKDTFFKNNKMFRLFLRLNLTPHAAKGWDKSLVGCC